MLPVGGKTLTSRLFSPFLFKGFNFGIFQRKFGQCQIPTSLGVFFCLNKNCIWFLFMLVVILITETNTFLPCIGKKQTCFTIKSFFWQKPKPVKIKKQVQSRVPCEGLPLRGFESNPWGLDYFHKGYTILFKFVAPFCISTIKAK